MVKIFAKYGTDEKALVVCSQDQVRNIQISLAKRYGGNWIWVDKLQPNGEILHFKDNLVYRGFHGKNERYCNGIQKLSE